MIKNALFIFLFILMTVNFSFSNENEKNYVGEINYSLFTFQSEIDEVNIFTEDMNDSVNNYFVFNFNTENLKNYAAKNKSSNAAQYKKYRKIGIGLLVPGVILFASSFILMGVGAFLIAYTERRNIHYWSYGSEYYGSEGYQPYQSVGIPLAGVGALFFCAGLPLLIVGVVNLVKAAKYKNRTGLSNCFALNLNYNPFDESINFNTKFSF